MNLLCLVITVALATPPQGLDDQSQSTIGPSPHEVLNTTKEVRSTGSYAVAGDDFNGDGVRDDIERWASINFPEDTSARAVVLQLGAAMQKVLTSGGEIDAVTAARFKKEIRDGLECMFASTDEAVQNKIFKELLQTILNTPEREAIISRLEERFPEPTGTFFSAPSTSKCHVQPGSLHHKP